MAALVLEVKGDFCHDIRRMLTELGRADDYIRAGRSSGTGRATILKPARLLDT